jgi:hypothetical protein
MGMRRGGPTPGALIAADPATVERSGFAIGHFAGFQRAAWGSLVKFGGMSEKPLAWHCDEPGRTPLLLRIVRLSRCRKRREGEASPFGLLPHRFSGRAGSSNVRP